MRARTGSMSACPAHIDLRTESSSRVTADVSRSTDDHHTAADDVNQRPE